MIKRWNLEEMKIRLENLKKVISPTIVELHIWQARFKTNDELDALYLAYYDLKDMYLKYNRGVFGTVNQVDYKPKTNNVWTINYNYDIYNPSYDYIHYNNYDTVTTTNIVASTSTAPSLDWSDYYGYYFDRNQMFR